MTFSIKDAVKNIREHYSPNHEVTNKLRLTANCIFEILENTLQDTTVWVLREAEDGDFCHLNVTPANQYSNLLDKLIIRLYEDSITIDAFFPSDYTREDLIRYTDLFTPFVRDKTAHYDFPVTLVVHTTDRDVAYSIEYNPGDNPSSNN
ncbi:TPA: hypothetical protein OKR56_000644 [Escherichia coli]|nr:hypothetical protein [Escherichia coli]